MSVKPPAHHPPAHGPRPHHSDKWRRCFADVLAKGHTRHEAAAICTNALGTDTYDRNVPIDLAAVVVDAVESAIALALAPVGARLRAVETKAADVGALQDKIAALDAAPPAPGPAGPPGPAGADGLGVDDLALEYDGERTITLAWTAGDGRRVARPITLPTMIYQGVYVAGKAYARGDVVTWGGSLWHANCGTSTRPGDGAPDWTLAVKRGRDGAGARP